MSSYEYVKDERGAALVEYAIGATVFLSVLFGVVEFGRALWVHNALTDATRRGARYAILNSSSKSEAVKNVAVYGDATDSSQPVVPKLTPDNVQVSYSPDYGLDTGTVTVSITEYDFEFVVPLIGRTMRMPAYSTTLTGECVGLIPPDM